MEDEAVAWAATCLENTVSLNRVGVGSSFFREINLKERSKIFNVHDKYDEFGVLKSIPWEDIKKGDKVLYIAIP